MQITKLDQLVKAKFGPKAWAKMTNNNVYVSTPLHSQFVLEYTRGETIMKVAKQLDLIPEIDITKEAHSIARRLKQGQAVVIGYTVCFGCLESIWFRYHNKKVNLLPAGVDDFGRPLARFYLV